jgi:hypothetical protein
MFRSEMDKGAELFFHSPCFDGIASAVIAVDYLQQHEAWPEINLHRVNYDERDSWLSRTFDVPFAVVDFLYHPGARFWADHHLTTFLTPEAQRDYERRDERHVIYDRNADSCAGLLRRHLAAAVGYRNERFEELVHWAEKIDAARYESVDEAFSFNAPAIRISLSLALATDSYCESLVRALLRHSLADTSALPEVSEKFERVRGLSEAGLQRFRSGASLRDGIVVFMVDGRGVMVNRYAPYRIYPQARYSVGAVRSDSGVKITAMRNPWLQFESVPLGEIFREFGGGGHQRVASTVVGNRSEDEVRRTVDSILAAIERMTPRPSTVTA